MHPCKHELMLKILGLEMKQDIQRETKQSTELKSDPMIIAETTLMTIIQNEIKNKIIFELRHK